MASSSFETLYKLRDSMRAKWQPSKSTSDRMAVPQGIDYSAATRTLALRDGLRQLYPPLDPDDNGFLKVDDLHEMYWEACGNPKGVPVIFLHGGPGGGCSTTDRRWFDPKHYRIYLIDQRGSGRSKPHAELKDNTTWHLVADIEKLRQHVGVDKWHIFGGSWGSCLCLAYAQTHPDRVLSLVLRGIFTLRRSELLFFYQDGASHIFPEQFEPYREHIPEAERGDMIAAYYKRLTSDDEKERLQAAILWSTWENATCTLYVNEKKIQQGKQNKEWALAFARIEAHYFYNKGWFEDGQLLTRESIDKIRHLPAVIVQGRYDCVCPAISAYELHKQWPEAEFHMLQDNGHSATESGIQHGELWLVDWERISSAIDGQPTPSL